MLDLKSSGFRIEDHSGESPNSRQHFHSFVEFYYLKSGRISYFTDNKTFSVEKGDFLIIPPNTIHNSLPGGTQKRHRILIYLNESFVTSFAELSSLTKTGPLLFHLEDTERASQIIFQLLEEDKNQRNENMLVALLIELLITLSRKTSVSVLPKVQPVVSSRLSDILDYINANYSSSISLSSVAKKFYLNSSYLSRLFREKTGLTFTAYLNKQRVINAIKMLSSTDKTITDIALLNGFASSNSFCKVFKANLGTSPLKYRKGMK